MRESDGQGSRNDEGCTEKAHQEERETKLGRSVVEPWIQYSNPEHSSSF